MPTILPHMDAAAIPDQTSRGHDHLPRAGRDLHRGGLFTQPDYAEADLVPSASLSEALETVGSGGATLAFLPIENSIEGAVNATVDSLVFEADLLIQREVVLDIHLHLAARPGTALESVTRVLSIPVASAQCRRYLAAQLPKAEIVATNSTAEAAQIVSADPQPGAAALAPRLAAELYGLAVIAAASETTRKTRLASSPWPRQGCRLPPATTRRASSASSARIAPAACTPF